MKEFGKISIVVCTYNRAEHLGAALQSLDRLATEGLFEYEIVVIDNASSDRTAEVIAECRAACRTPIRSFFESRPGVSCARNRGVAETRFDWIAFFDDDQLADSTWLVELVDTARRRGARCVGGSNRLKFEPGPEPLVARECRELLSEMNEEPHEHLHNRRAAPGCGNLLIHRSVFEEVGVFDETLTEAGEDADLFRRVFAAGIDAWFTPKAISRHYVPAYRLKPEYIRWKALRNGGHVARRNLADWNRAAFAVILLARIGKAVLLDLPRFAWKKFTAAPEIALGARSRLWRTEGYVRFALNFLAPRLFAQQKFFAGLEFRAERNAFGATETMNAPHIG